jgi:hypothetical protein
MSRSVSGEVRVADDLTAVIDVQCLVDGASEAAEVDR